jgi:cysteinyl-tRNA synthetase
MKLMLFNTEKKEKEQVSGNVIRMYTCGPTVYDYAHIGNFRTYVFEDLLRRTLKFLGSEVKQVMNITDVDDKTIKGACAKKIGLEEYTKPFIDAFFEDVKHLNIESADFYPKATNFIADMIVMIETLLNKGYAYIGHDKSVYFSIRKFGKYGRLSHLQLDELKVGASCRVEGDEYDKENAADFVLWKSYDASRDGNIYWDSPFGLGRPGWHIECSVMALKLLGDNIDIHCGGVDNIFPHHENEIAQSEAFNDKNFVKIWAHSAHLVVNGKKMSKSLGNFFTLRDLFSRGYSGREVRYMLLHTHYRTNLNFTFEGLAAIRASLRRIDDFIFRLESVKISKIDNISLIDKSLEAFTMALCDDLNISEALAVVFNFIKDMNILLDKEEVSITTAQASLLFLKKIDEVLGFIWMGTKESIPLEVKEAVDKREIARKEKNWKMADEMRNFIVSKGFIVEDTPDGPVVKPKNGY